MEGRIGTCRHGASLNVWCERCRGATPNIPPDIAAAIAREQEMVERLTRLNLAYRFPHLARLIYGEESQEQKPTV